MVELNGLNKVYAGSVHAVKDVSLQVQKGEIFGFLGPNGAGKSTTIKMIVGLLKPTNGIVRINGVDLATDPISAKKEIGYIADEPLVMEKVTGAEYLNFIADVFGVSAKARTDRVTRLLQHFKLTNAVRDPISTYSHGMRQKIALIGALIHNPRLWILDEPIVGLDPESAFVLKQMMRRHADSGNTVFFSTHVMEIAEKICDRIGIIHRGSLQFVGSVDELRKARGDKSLEKLFFEVTDSETQTMDFSFLDSAE
jgi:ABC-2 type transport system ATP-binding protein